MSSLLEILWAWEWGRGKGERRRGSLDLMLLCCIVKHKSSYSGITIHFSNIHAYVC